MGSAVKRGGKGRKRTERSIAGTVRPAKASLDETLSVNAAVELGCGRHAEERVYSSVVEDMDARHIYVSSPGDGGEPLYPGSTVMITYEHGGRIYRFTTQVVERRYEPLPTLVLARPATVKRIQRRGFVRLEVSLPVSARVLAVPVEAPSDEPSEHEADGGEEDPQRDTAVDVADDELLVVLSEMEAGEASPEAVELLAEMGYVRERPSRVVEVSARDLGAGGMMIVAPEELAEGTLLEVDFGLPTGDTFSLLARVVRFIKTVRRGSRLEHWSGVRFIGIDDDDRDLITRYIFQEERLRRKKGLL